MADNKISLVVGLGNPGGQYEDTRHNVGFWLLDEWAARSGATFRQENKFFGWAARIDGVWALKPSTFMNRSGQAVSAIAKFYKIPVQEILVIHDELDMDPGVAKLKQGGGHAGHNGLRDIISACGKDFYRLRVGIAHPGDRNKVADYVLSRPSKGDREAIDDAIYRSLNVFDDVLGGRMSQAMNELHRKA